MVSSRAKTKQNKGKAVIKRYWRGKEENPKRDKSGEVIFLATK